MSEVEYEEMLKAEAEELHQNLLADWERQLADMRADAPF